MNTQFNLKHIRQILGIFILFMGSPLIFFFKETLGFGGSSNFTIASFFVGFALMISPRELFRKFYKPNIPVYRLAFIYLSIALINFFFANSDYSFSVNRIGFFRDLGGFVFIGTFFFLLLGVSNDIKEYFLPIVVALTFLGSVCLIYSMASNPLFILGQRATVVFGDGTSEASGNPHVYARNAFGGIIASYLLMKSKSLFWKFFSITNLILSSIVLVLSQVRSILLALAIVIAIFVYYNISLGGVIRGLKRFFNPRTIFISIIVLSGFLYFVSTQPFIVNTINMYYDASISSFIRAVTTTLGKSDSETIDYSAVGRINNFAKFTNTLSERPWSVFLGNGYKFNYMDIPILETLIDCGILGFLSFGLMNFYIFKASLIAIKDGTNQFTVFLGYFYMTYFVGIFTGGEPYGTGFWYIFCVMIRFLGIKYLTPAQRVKSLNVTSELIA
jgi:hypothetical protein